MNHAPKEKIVLHVLPGLGTHGTLGGADRVAVTLVKALETAARYRPRLCVMRAADPMDARYGLSAPITFLDYGGPDQDWRMAAACSLKLRRLIRSVQPDIVHSHLWPAAFTAGIALLGSGIPHVIHVHDQRAWLSSRLFKHMVRRCTQRLVMRGSGAICVACSKDVADFTIKHLACDPGSMRVVLSGIEDSGLTNVQEASGEIGPARPAVLGLAARIIPDKGVAKAIAACASLTRRGMPYRLKIAGTGSARAECESLAAELGIRDCVEFLGPVKDMTGFYAGIDVFLLPSIGTEGLPLAILEAMMAGRPVVATRISGVPEAVTDGHDGFLVPPGDADALAAALERLIEDPAKLRAFGRHARERALRDFTVERMTSEFIALYDELSPIRSGG